MNNLLGAFWNNWDWMNKFWDEFQANFTWWALLGFIAQAVFSARFVLQWVTSEKHGKSIIPVSFWYLSIVGSLGLLIYAIHRADPVFILAYAFNGFIYVRNLMLISKEKKQNNVSKEE